MTCYLRTRRDAREYFNEAMIICKSLEGTYDREFVQKFIEDTQEWMDELPKRFPILDKNKEEDEKENDRGEKGQVIATGQKALEAAIMLQGLSLDSASPAINQAFQGAHIGLA